MSNKLWMIPVPIAENGAIDTNTATIGALKQTKSYVVERLRTARRWIKLMYPEAIIDELRFYELDKHGQDPDLFAFLSAAIQRGDVGVMSEAGCPGVADPGHKAVQWAHSHNISVRPIVGPSSILLALMGSGFQGQNFTFLGYLSNKKPELIRQLKDLETSVTKTGQTVLFMDAPYRNAFLLDSCCEALQGNTRICIACDINDNTEWIANKSIKEWTSFDKETLHKRPAIFLMGKY